MLEQSVGYINNIDSIIELYGNTIFRICFLTLCNNYDAESAVQETIIKYINKMPSFSNEDDEKKWLIAAAINSCKGIRLFSFKRPQVNIKNLELYTKQQENYNILEILMKVPYKYKVVLLLYYVEGYKIYEIAKILKISDTSVRRQLQRAKEFFPEVFSTDDSTKVNKVKDTVYSIEMSNVMRYRIKSFIKKDLVRRK